MANRDQTAGRDPVAPDWEAFYRSYRKPGYVPGYEITHKLGGGQFGLVFRARKQSIGKDYAIKFLQVEDGEVRSAIANELAQLRHVAQIDHPNLVAIEDRGEVDGIPYLVMAFAGTDTLQSRLPGDGTIAAGALKDELLRLFVQACRGTAALHEHGMVHFDIKPANVFCKGGIARVGDYGLSKLVTLSRGTLSAGRGTPHYMAPELLQRRGDARSDIYSLGVVLYEILCGRVPFTGDSEWQVLRLHETQAPAMPEHLVASERALLQRCLAKDPAARFVSVHDLLAALGAPAMPPAVAATPAAHPVDGDLAGCVPPWPETSSSETAVASSPMTRAGAAAGRTSRGSTFPVVVVCMLVAFVAFRWVSPRVPSHRSEASARFDTVDSRGRPRPAPRAMAGGLSGQLQQFLGEAKREVRTAEARSKRSELVAPQFACGEIADLDAVTRLVDALADAPTFSAGHTTKLERYGFATFVAGVRRLQQLDYRDGRDCRRGSHLSHMLAQLLDVPNLVMEVPPGPPQRSDECRCRAIAASWRKLADRFAADEAAYGALLAACGKGARSELR